jgi:hypothetical protein
VNGTNGALYGTADDLKSAVLQSTLQCPSSAALARKRGQNKRKRGKDASRAACLLCSVLEKGEVCSLEKYWKADMCPPASELPILYFTIVKFSIAIRRGLLYFTIVNF